MCIILLFFIIYLFKKSDNLGKLRSFNEIKIFKTLSDTLSIFRELKLNNQSKQFIERYKKVLVSLRTVFSICKKYNYYNNIDDIYVKYPRFLLDDFFYHLHRIHVTSYMTDVIDLCNTYEHMANIIINKMDEKAFDVSSWGDDVEWRVKRSLYLLDKIDSSR